MKEINFTGRELESALNDDLFKQIRPDIQLVGMIKKSEKEGYIGFTQSDCGTWIDLPTKMIERAEFIENSICKDHSHPVMKITLKRSDNPEHEVLLSLLQMSNQSESSNYQAINQLLTPNELYGRPLEMESSSMMPMAEIGGVGIKIFTCKWDWVPCIRCAFGRCWQSWCIRVHSCKLGG